MRGLIGSLTTVNEVTVILSTIHMISARIGVFLPRFRMFLCGHETMESDRGPCSMLLYYWNTTEIRPLLSAQPSCRLSIRLVYTDSKQSGEEKAPSRELSACLANSHVYDQDLSCRACHYFSSLWCSPVSHWEKKSFARCYNMLTPRWDPLRV